MNAKAIEIKQGLQLIHGSEHLQRIPLLRTCYTEGIDYLAKSADCYWLVTDASVIAKSLMNRRRFIERHASLHQDRGHPFLRCRGHP